MTKKVEPCPRLSKCPMVNDSANKHSALNEKIKEQFCNHNHTQCARYFIIKILGGEFVPHDLQPNQMKRAKKLIISNQDLL
jgi:hypothetical protein